MAPTVSASGKQILVSYDCLDSLIYPDLRVAFVCPETVDGFKKSHWLSVSSAFSYCKDKSDDFQAFYMFEYLTLFFHIYF